jgi:hypothetical protein
MDMKVEDVGEPGQRTDHAPDLDTRPRRPDHVDAIAGWGSDLDRANRPAVPMERRPPRLPHHHAQPISPQPLHTEVLHSVERPGVTPLFGSPNPPRGLSGWLRRLAFGYSENDLRHWLVLLFADRVDVVEGLVDDVAHGHLPRLYAETGGRAELKHNPAAAARKAAALVTVAGIGYLLWKRSRARPSD